MQQAIWRFFCFVFLIASGMHALAVEPVIVPGDNLVVEGIPPIPTALAEKVRRYTEFRAATLFGWHPTRREMLIGTRFGDTVQAHLVKFPGGARTQLTFFAERVMGASYQPTKGEYFVFSKDVGGNEFFQLYRFDVASGDVALLTDGKSRNTGGKWSHGGDRFVYGSTRRNGKDVDFYVVNPADLKSDRLLTENEGGGWAAVDWSPEDRQILAIERFSATESYLWLVDPETGAKTLVTPKGNAEKISYDDATFSHDGKGLYVATDKDAEFRRLCYLDLATKEHVCFTPEIPWDVDSLALSSNGETLAFVTNENGIDHLRLFDTRARKQLPELKIPMGVISGLEWHENARDLGFSISSARSTLDAYSFNVPEGKLERWTTSETGGLNTDTFSEPELVRWPSFDGREISGFLYLPPAKFTRPRPVMMIIHGGPESQSRPGFLARNNYFLNELGVALLLPNIRGSAGYGKTFLQLDNGFRREDTYKDIGSLLDWIAKQPKLDAKRVMVTGGSYGGHMSFAVATRYNDRIAATLPVVGISNFVSFLERTESYRRDLRRVEYGDERDPKMREFMERIAPLNNAAAITKPMFVVQGGNDPRVPLNEAEQMVKTVRKNATPVWYLMAKDEGHGFAKKKNQDFQFYATIEFVEKFLLTRQRP